MLPSIGEWLTIQNWQLSSSGSLEYIEIHKYSSFLKHTIEASTEILWGDKSIHMAIYLAWILFCILLILINSFSI